MHAALLRSNCFGANILSDIYNLICIMYYMKGIQHFAYVSLILLFLKGITNNISNYIAHAITQQRLRDGYFAVQSMARGSG